MPRSRLLEYCHDSRHPVAQRATTSHSHTTFKFWLFLGPLPYTGQKYYVNCWNKILMLHIQIVVYISVSTIEKQDAKRNLKCHILGVADKAPDLIPNVVKQNQYCRWKEGSVHVSNCKSFLVTKAERKHVRQHTWFRQHRDVSCHQVTPQGKALKEIHAILKKKLGEHAPLYATIKNWLAQFKRGDFSIRGASHPGWPKTVMSQEIIDQIHELILED